MTVNIEGENRMRLTALIPALIIVCLISSAASSEESDITAFIEKLPVTQREMAYKTVGDVSLKLHIFELTERTAGAKRPAIVFFFGGGWTGGTPSQFFPHCRYLASRGMTAVSAEYRVKSRHGTTPLECVADGKSAVRWLRLHADELGIDQDKIAGGGGSAGGHVGACTGVIEGLDEEGENLKVSSRPNALVLFNPVTDTTPERWRERMGPRARDISPNHHIRKGLPPTIIFHGTADTTVPIEQVETFARLMNEAGNTCRLVPFKGMKHAFFNYGKFENKPFVETVGHMDRFLVSLGYIEGEPTLP